MPHAVEMPSFLSDDDGPILSSNTSSFDLPIHLRQSHEKPNGNSRPMPRTSTNGSIQNGSDYYQEGINGNRNSTNSDMQPVKRLDPLPNGRPSGSSWDRSSINGSIPSVNGSSSNGGAENGQRSPALQNSLTKTASDNRTSYSSMNGVAEPQTPPTTMSSNGEAAPSLNGNSQKKQISIPPPISTNPQSTGPLVYTSSLLPASPPSDALSPRTNPSSPHRFSSPPAIPPSSANSLSTANSPNQGIRQRHTLEVPKTSTSRSSRDSTDFASASGRFSPTTQRGSMGLIRRPTRSMNSELPQEEVPQDEDAVRWAEAMRQKRVSKRKRKEEEEDDERVVVGNRIDQNHQNYVTAYHMLTGIRFTVSRTNAKLDRDLTPADFEAKHKFSFDM